jgi:hypothetical protein
MKKTKKLTSLLIMSALICTVFSACDKTDGNSSSALADNVNATVTAEPVVTDAAGNTLVDFEKTFLYSENAEEQPYSFVFDNMRKAVGNTWNEDLEGRTYLIENTAQLNNLNLNYTYENEYFVDGVKNYYNSPQKAKEIQQEYDEMKEKISGYYNDYFFGEYSLVFFDITLPTTPNTNVLVEKVYKDNGVLKLYIHNYEPGMNEALQPYCGVIKVKKSDLEDIKSVKIEYQAEYSGWEEEPTRDMVENIDLIPKKINGKNFDYVKLEGGDVDADGKIRKDEYVIRLYDDSASDYNTDEWGIFNVKTQEYTPLLINSDGLKRDLLYSDKDYVIYIEYPGDEELIGVPRYSDLCVKTLSDNKAKVLHHFKRTDDGNGGVGGTTMLGKYFYRDGKFYFNQSILDDAGYKADEISFYYDVASGEVVRND